MERVDTIYKNGKVYTVNDVYPWATAFAVKGGKFVYVGDDKGADEYEGQIVDLDGRFVMPGILDAHVHVGWGSKARLEPPVQFLMGNSKAEILAGLRKVVEENPNEEKYKRFIAFSSLKGEKLTREDLDEICPDKPLLVVELEQHSRWMNSLEMKVEHIDDFEPDIAPGLSFMERDERGRVNGRIFEFCGLKDLYNDYSMEVFAEGLEILQTYWKKWGVIGVFDAGTAVNDLSTDNLFTSIMKKDAVGELPTYIESCYYIYDPKQFKDAVKNAKEYRSKYTSDHLNVRTVKIMMDGTHNGHTAALFENYSDSDVKGGTLTDPVTLKNLIINLNAENLDLHVHTVGERAIATVLDAVEMARKELGSSYHMQVTCAHVETIRLQDIGRFAELGVLCNFTPHWFGGNVYNGYEPLEKLLGPTRSLYTHRANSIWNTGAVVSFGSDPITIMGGDMAEWNPYQGMEVGITRQNSSMLIPFDNDYSDCIVFPPNEERLTLEQMIKGYTLNAAKQMRLDGKVGSIQAGKEASFLIFKESLFDIDKYKLHKAIPDQVYIRGKRI